MLIFAQSPALLDAAERGLLAPHYPGIGRARIDGAIAPARRIEVARRFNADPAMQLLLLTTAVGGLGLTLTGADTVVFLDSDWNPFRDRQAMDRAHRLGQRRAVTVYRLLARGTLEERVMALQRFKSAVADAAVGSGAGADAGATGAAASADAVDAAELLRGLGPAGAADAAGVAAADEGDEASALMALVRSSGSASTDAADDADAAAAAEEAQFEREAAAARLETLALPDFLRLLQPRR